MVSNKINIRKIELEDYEYIEKEDIGRYDKIKFINISIFYDLEFKEAVALRLTKEGYVKMKEGNYYFISRSNYNFRKLTDEDKVTLETVLSPSIVNILRKIAPELGPLLAQAGSNEENVVLPVSVVKNYAIRKYGGDEAEAVQNFITDLSGEQSDNTNVPPGAAEGSQGMMAQQSPPETETSGANFDRIDQGLA